MYDVVPHGTYVCVCVYTLKKKMQGWFNPILGRIWTISNVWLKFNLKM